MKKDGPIVLIDDDPDDAYLLKLVIEELKIKNQLICFTDGIKAIEFLKADDVQPFMILSDINMPKINGFETRKIIFANKKMREKCVPYIFMSTECNPKNIQAAYEQSIQGFFPKPTTHQQLKEIIGEIICYWKSAVAP